MGHGEGVGGWGGEQELLCVASLAVYAWLSLGRSGLVGPYPQHVCSIHLWMAPVGSGSGLAVWSHFC